MTNLMHLNTMDISCAKDWFMQTCTASAWCELMTLSRPYASLDQVIETGSEHWQKMRTSDFIEAFESLSDDIDIDCFDFQKDIVPSLFRYSPSYAVCVSLHWEFDQEGEIAKLEFLRIFWRSFAGVCCETDLNESLSNMRDHVAEALDYVIKNGSFPLIGSSYQERSLKRKTDYFLRWKSIEDHLVTARWQKSVRTRLIDTSSLNAELDIRNFIDAYLSEHGKLPVGDCIVGGTHVFFSEGDANV